MKTKMKMKMKIIGYVKNISYIFMAILLLLFINSFLFRIDTTQQTQAKK